MHFGMYCTVIIPGFFFVGMYVFFIGLMSMWLQPHLLQPHGIILKKDFDFIGIDLNERDIANTPKSEKKIIRKLV